MANTFKELPLAEITLRKYEKPSAENERDLVKKFCLSLGLLQPGDSRDIIIDILLILLKSEKPVKSDELREKVIEYRKLMNLPLTGIAHSNIRRQLLRLKNLYLIEKKRDGYRITENTSLKEILLQRIKPILLEQTYNRILEYAETIDKNIRKCAE
ncbi:hypothetical protein DRJ16_02265 [Candidatus Woesearchaeota archaeon]|nr:MAG: hypothetical protein DRJ16_02265 [Candidatus Woesearchaeota archaeon]